VPAVRRGDVFRVNFGRRKGREQEGLRPAIVVQADLYCSLSTIWVLPISTKARPEIDFHVPVTIQGKRTYALIEQLTTVDRKRRLRPENYLGQLTAEEMARIDEMMRIFGGLDPQWGLRF
jgi:mRNA-degrading endonuclease toxin of MazEF toxin-antitoxin module